MENSIVFTHVNKAYGNNLVVEDLNLEIRRGERLILLGPSGCGKTTTLRMIAGLEEITSGELYMEGRLVNKLEPGLRNIAMVFQSYALFPHMTVWENITFGLRLQKLAEEEINRRGEQALEILHLADYKQKKTHELSGGQKQRVALCRALVKHSPYFLLDEPLSNLDAQLRQQARTELVRLHEMFRPTMIYVTHDQIEAMTVADRIVVMNKGKVQQIDTPENIYRHPANTFVAGFIGSPAMNLFQGTYAGGELYLGGCIVSIPEEWKNLLAGHRDICVGLRPEACIPKFTEAMVNCTVEFMENTGNLQTASLRLSNGEGCFLQVSNLRVDLTQLVGFDFEWSNISLFDAATGMNIGYVR